MIIIVFFITLTNYSNQKKILKTETFDIKNNLQLLHFDCKTNVDNLHIIVGFATSLSDFNFSKINYHIVAGTYAVQKVLYVLPNNLVELSFGNNWTVAHENFDTAIKKVQKIVKQKLDINEAIWIAKVVQTDFTVALVKSVQTLFSQINIAKRIHVIQHSFLNKKMTNPKHLDFVKNNTNYFKIPMIIF